MMLLLNVLHVKNLHKKIVPSYSTLNLSIYLNVKTCNGSATLARNRASQYILTLKLNYISNWKRCLK